VDTIKKNNKVSKTEKSLAIIPTTTAESGCLEQGDLTVKVFMAASGGEW
jgi:hypothetical protein